MPDVPRVLGMQMLHPGVDLVGEAGVADAGGSGGGSAGSFLVAVLRAHGGLLPFGWLAIAACFARIGSGLARLMHVNVTGRLFPYV